MAQRQRRLPKMPKSAFSVLGPLPVAVVENLEGGESLGLAEWLDRTIKVEAGAGARTQLQTYWHEAAHFAMWDGGCHDALTEVQREAVCNAMGTYLAAAHIAGFLKVCEPRG